MGQRDDTLAGTLMLLLVVYTIFAAIFGWPSLLDLFGGSGGEPIHEKF